MTERDDLVQATLLRTRSEIAPSLNEDLLLKCYQIEKLHQYERDRSIPFQQIWQLVEDFLDSDTYADQYQRETT